MTVEEAWGQAFENGRQKGDAEGYARGLKEAYAEAGDLISRKALLAVLKHEGCDYELFPAVVNEAPAVAAQPVKHGRWIGCRCSVCDRSALEDEDIDTGEYDVVLSAYCPNCGARMDGDGNA